MHDITLNDIPTPADEVTTMQEAMIAALTKDVAEYNQYYTFCYSLSIDPEATEKIDKGVAMLSNMSFFGGVNTSTDTLADMPKVAYASRVAGMSIENVVGIVIRRNFEAFYKGCVDEAIKHIMDAARYVEEHDNCATSSIEA